MDLLTVTHDRYLLVGNEDRSGCSKEVMDIQKCGGDSIN